MKYKFTELVDISKLQDLMEGFYSVTGIPSTVLDTDLNILIGFGWQDICSKFHRVNKQTELLCKQSDLSIKKALDSNFGHVSNICYKCGNGLVDVAYPIIIDGEHLATIFTGQFLFEEPDIEQFRRQAQKYGFNEEEYINAVKKVPIFTKEKVDLISNYVRQLAEMMVQMGLAKLQLIESQERAMQESENLIKELRKIDQNKNQFIRVLSHELRNPLASIMMSLSFLDSVESDGEQARQAKEVLKRQTNQLSRLVDDLLDVTRITRNKINLKKECVNLNELISRVVEDNKLQFDKKEVSLKVELTSTPLFLEADPARLTQVVGNLLDNSAKFTAKGDNVLVTVWKDENTQEAVICIKDNGMGIRPERLPDLFTPFIQVDSSLTQNSGGLGLGLSIVKGTVELHGGSVCASSEGLGKGAEFTIRLPLFDVSTGEQVQQPQISKERPQIRRILVIDDIPDVAEILCALLQQMGYEVISANNGSEGITKAKEFRPDVILCDIGMPGMNGYEVATNIRCDNELNDVFLIAVTGYAQPEDRMRARESGFDRHIAKPVDLDTLKDALAEVS